MVRKRPSAREQADKNRIDSAQRRRRTTSAGQDIGPIPPVVNLERKAAASASLLQFKKTYFPHRFTLPFSGDHFQVTARFDQVINDGGVHAVAMPRGSGKTTETIVGTIWATLTGRAKFAVPIGSSRERALAMLRAVKFELMSNQLLYEDFPEVCYPIRRLENRANRCKGQHSNGEPTDSVWSTEKIILPTIKGSRASGAIVYALGIKGSIRGLMEGTLRPDLVIPDDVQKRGSAKSLMQRDDILQIINGDIMGLAGPGQKFALIMPCTIIYQDDVSSTVLDREKTPLFTGQTYRMVYQFPTNISLWDDYSTRRNDEFRNGGDGSEATAYYEANREAMDLGAVVAWPENFKRGEVSGIQHAMNLLYADKWAFWAEYQNQPLSEDLGDGQLEKDKVAARVNGLNRSVLPLACSKVTAFIDVQQKVLFWTICAWSEDFTGSIIDYGAWPEQGRRYFTAADVQQTFARKFPGAGLEAQIHAALGVCADELFGRTFAREDGAAFRIEKMLIDAGFQGETVKTWARTTHHAALVMPSHGHAIGASGKPWSEYDRTRCEKLGLHWMIPKLAPGKASLRHVTIDVNYWKSFVASRLKQAIGEKGALTLWGKAGTDHRMLADHLTAEYWIPTEGRGRKVQEWRMRPGMADNHWWDGVVGCAVAASMQGARIIQGVPDVPKKRVSFAEMQRKQMERAAQPPAKEEKKPEAAPAPAEPVKGRVSFAEMQRRGNGG